MPITAKNRPVQLYRIPVVQRDGLKVIFKTEKTINYSVLCSPSFLAIFSSLSPHTFFALLYPHNNRGASMLFVIFDKEKDRICVPLIFFHYSVALYPRCERIMDFCLTLDHSFSNCLVFALVKKIINYTQCKRKLTFWHTSKNSPKLSWEMVKIFVKIYWHPSLCRIYKAIVLDLGKHKLCTHSIRLCA